MTTLRTRATMRLLATFESFLALCALYGGISLIAGAPGFTMPVEWLAPLGLNSWVLPGVAFAACVVLTGWLAIQFAVIGLREPVQWVTLGLLALLLGLALLARHRLAAR